MTSGSASAAAAVSLGNNEALHHKQTVAQIRAGGGGRAGADVTSVAPANEVAALGNFSLDTTVAASANGEGRLRRERSSLCWAKKSEGIEGWVSDEKVARP